MRELVTIPISIFEIEVDYERPDFKILMDRTSLIQGIFEGLKPWEPRIDDVDAIATGRSPSRV
ncbi:MAG: hypothetical protein M3Y27_16495 [Acidobacteriota bacterium]|nr:hypothetical protein [Acidobacteriota bacterium]